MIGIEACVEDAAEAARAVALGATRIELCARLDLDGLTPSPVTVRETVSRVEVPVFVMIRPRAGDFVYSPDERASMRAQAAESIEAGADGLVFGLLTPEGDIDLEGTRELVQAAAGVPTTFHKAFDAVRDPERALDALLDLGIDRVLTSGGQPTAEEGANVLAALVARSAGRLSIVAGGRVRAENAHRILTTTGVTELHARAAAVEALARALG